MCLGLYIEWSYRENNEQANIIKSIHGSRKNFYPGQGLASALLEFLFWFIKSYLKINFIKRNVEKNRVKLNEPLEKREQWKKNLKR